MSEEAQHNYICSVFFQIEYNFNWICLNAQYDFKTEMKQTFKHILNALKRFSFTVTQLNLTILLFLFY